MKIWLIALLCCVCLLPLSLHAQINNGGGFGLPAGPTSPNVPFGLTCTPGGGVTCASAAWSWPGVLVNPQTGTSYTIAATDRGYMITACNSGVQTYTIPDGATLNFGNGFFTAISNEITSTCLGPNGTVTLARTTTSTINGANSIPIPAGYTAYIYLDGGNNWLARVFPSSPSANLITNGSVGSGGSNPPACAASGAGGRWCSTEGSAPTPVALIDDIHPDLVQHAMEVNNNNTGEMPISRTGCVNVTPVTTAGGNVTTDQNMQACTFSANLLNVVGRTVKVHAAGTYSTVAASSSAMSVEIQLCTVSGCGSGTKLDVCDITSSALGAITVTNNTWSEDCLFSTQTAGASAVFERSGNLTIDLLVSNAAADSVFLDPNATAVTSAIDSTSQLFLQVAGAFTVSNASNVFVGRQLIVEVLN